MPVTRPWHIGAPALDPAEHDLLPPGYLPNTGTGRQHNSRTFMTKEMRQESILAALAPRFHQLAVADARKRQFDKHLAGPRLRHLNVALNAQRLVWRVKNCRFHVERRHAADSLSM